MNSDLVQAYFLSMDKGFMVAAYFFGIATCALFVLILDTLSSRVSRTLAADTRESVLAENSTHMRFSGEATPRWENISSPAQIKKELMRLQKSLNLNPKHKKKR